MKYYQYPCGCKFKILQQLEDGELRLEFDPHVASIDLKCERTWDLISEGNTKGVFQLESRLGQSYAKKLKPRNIEHLAALVSILRPGCLEAIRDKKSITQHYIDRKNKEESVELYHPALQDALGPTYGEMIYQEQAMKIAQDIAGFNLQEADVLRKAIGKKKADIMSSLKSKFIDGCKVVGKVNEEQAEEIFGWIQKSQRYSFNKSHAVSYAINAYVSAYAKAHFPRIFITSYLYYAKEKQKPQEEIRELVNNANAMDIDVYPPDFRHLNKHFIMKDKNIYFGFTDIKGVGEAVVNKMADDIDTEKIRIDKLTWTGFLIFLSQKINSTAVKALISAGALDYMSQSRTRMLYEYEIYSRLSNREVQWVNSRYYEAQLDVRSPDSPVTEKWIGIQGILTAMIALPAGRQGACSNKNRLRIVEGLLESVNNPPYVLEDNPEWTSQIEASLLGIPLTCTSVEGLDVSTANCTCREFVHGKSGLCLIAVAIDEVHEIKTKKGKNPGQKMAFVRVSDISAALESVVAFPEPWKENKKLLVAGNNVIISGERGSEKDSFILDKVWQI